MEGPRKTIFTLAILTLSSSSLYSSPIPMTATENPSCFNCSTWSLMIETKGERTIYSVGIHKVAALFNTTRGNTLNIKLFPKPAGSIVKTPFPRLRSYRQIFCANLSASIFGKSSRHLSTISMNKRYGNATIGTPAFEIQRSASNANFTTNLLHSSQHEIMDLRMFKSRVNIRK